METFRIPSQAVALDHVHQVLDRQDEMIAPIFGKIIDAVEGPLAEQDAMVGAIQRKLHRALTSALTRQEKKVDQVATNMVVAAGQAIQRQQMLVDGIQAKMAPPEFKPPPGFQSSWVVACCPGKNGNTIIVYAVNAPPPNVLKCTTLGQFTNKHDAEQYAALQNTQQLCNAPPGTKACLVNAGGCWQGAIIPGVIKLDITINHGEDGLPHTMTAQGVFVNQDQQGGQYPHAVIPLVGLHSPLFAAEAMITCFPPAVASGTAQWGIEIIGQGSAGGTFGMQQYPLTPGVPITLPVGFSVGIMEGSNPPTDTGVVVSGIISAGDASTLVGSDLSLYNVFCGSAPAPPTGGPPTGGGPPPGGGPPTGGPGGNGQVCCPPEGLSQAPDPKYPASKSCTIAGITVPLLPVPGSQEFCDAFESVMGFWVDVGLQLAHILDEVVYFIGPPSRDTEDRLMQWFILQTNPVAQTVSALIKMLDVFRAGVASQLQQAVDCIKQVIASQKECNAPALIALWTLKAVMEFLENVRIGCDAGLWATVDLHFRPTQISQTLEYLINASCPVLVPHVPDAMEALAQGQIGGDVYRCWVKMHGAHPDVWEPVRQARSDRLSLREVIQWGRRNDQSPEATDNQLIKHGWIRDDDRFKAQELYDQLPTIVDHLHWLQRNVDVTEYVKKYALLDGFAPDAVIQTLPGYADYITTTDQQGRDFWGSFGPDLHAQGLKQKYAALHYAAHWIQPSPTQMQEFVYRLRPEVVAPGRAFVLDDFRRILMEQDYAPRAIQWFMDTVYRVLAPGHLIELYRYSVVTYEEVLSGYQDFGYSPRDAKRLADTDVQVKARLRTAESHGYTPMIIRGLIRTGRQTEEWGVQQMARMGYTDQEALDSFNAADDDFARQIADSSTRRTRWRLETALRNSYSVGVISAQQLTDGLVNLGYTQQSAEVTVKAVEASSQADMAKKLVSTMRRAFLHGGLSYLEAQTYLAQAGIAQARIEQYLTVWLMERSGERAQASAAQVLRWFNEGLLPRAMAATRLTNLGWQEPDIILLLQEAGMKPNPFERMKQSEKRRLIADLKQQQPLSLLRKLYGDGLIDRGAVARQLDLYGYAQMSINRYLAMWDREIADALARKAKASAKEVVAAERGNISLGWVQKLAKGGVIDEPTARAILITDGYSADAIAEYLALFFA